MGNRAVISTGDKPGDIGLYLHWNGGRASVQGFLDACKAAGYRDPTSDPAYGMARLCAAVCAYFGLDGETSVGIGTVAKLDCNNFDNGLYILGPGWTIAKRKYHKGAEEVDAEKTAGVTAETLKAIGDASARRTAEIAKSWQSAVAKAR
jgi:hypothetical protein